MDTSNTANPPGQNDLKGPLEMLYRWERTSPERVYLRQPIQGAWTEFTWRRAGDEVRRMATALQGLGLPPGSHVAIGSKNCAHWILADLAIWMSGHVSVPLYPNLSTATVKQILEHSEAKALFLGKLDKFEDYVRGIPRPMPTITFPYESRPDYLKWDDLVKANAPMTASPVRRLDEMATIIYTSGTTGMPKGVAHHFISFATAGRYAPLEFAVTQNDRFFSYLPLAHVAERLLTETIALYGGASVSFVESLDLFAKNMQEVQPTIFLGVPRIWEKFRAGILAKLPAAKLDRLLRLPVVSSLIRRKIQKGLGLSQARGCVTGAAATSVDLLEFFSRLGIPIQEGYGLTENFAYTTITRPGRERFGAVGQPWPLSELRLGEGGEIQAKSPCLMVGYFKEPAATAQVVKDGWLCTGDQGAIDADGYLRITGRVKEMFKTAKGKYVAPSPIELRLTSETALEHACVLGESLSSAMAVVTLSEIGKTMDRNTLAAKLRSLLASVNAKLDPHERLGRLLVVSDTWTVENDYLTPTMKLKRRLVEKKYCDRAAELDRARGEDVVFG